MHARAYGQMRDKDRLLFVSPFFFFVQRFTDEQTPVIFHASETAAVVKAFLGQTSVVSFMERYRGCTRSDPMTTFPMIPREATTITIVIVLGSSCAGHAVSAV